MKSVRSTDDSFFPLNRRAFLAHYAGAIGTLALAHLLEHEQARAGTAKDRTVHAGLTNRVEAARKSRARSVICLFQHGGPSQMDLFDPKPDLVKHQGNRILDNLRFTLTNRRGNCSRRHLDSSRTVSRERCSASSSRICLRLSTM